MVQDHFWKKAFLTHFSPLFDLQIPHIVKVFWDFLCPKMRDLVLKMG